MAEKVMLWGHPPEGHGLHDTCLVCEHDALRKYHTALAALIPTS